MLCYAVSAYTKATSFLKHPHKTSTIKRLCVSFVYRPTEYAFCVRSCQKHAYPYVILGPAGRLCDGGQLQCVRRDNVIVAG